MIYATGDTHGIFTRFSTAAFPEQKAMTKDDYMIICGDFGGIWRQKPDSEECYWLDWLNDKNFTLLWVDGNHENFGRLNSDEFEIVDFGGAKAQRIRDSVYRLLRGQVYTLNGKQFFTFGGAASHDIEDGILDPADFADPRLFEARYRRWRSQGLRFRVRGVSWWPEELPDEEEMRAGVAALEDADLRVDCVISHCLPQDVVPLLGCPCEPDRLTLYFNDLLARGLRFDDWYCGHYHADCRLMGRFHVLYERIERLE